MSAAECVAARPAEKLAAVATFVGGIMHKLGARATIGLGLVCMSAFTLLFGLSPVIARAIAADQGGSEQHMQEVEEAVLPWLFIGFAFMYGAGSTLAETGAFAQLTNLFPDDLGKVLALSEVVTGAGAMVGPFVGGIVFDALSGTDASAGDGVDMQFLWTFVVFGCTPLLTMVLLLGCVPSASSKADADADIEAEAASPAKSKIRTIVPACSPEA